MIQTTTRLRSINPVQLALTLGIIYAVLALIVAILYVLFGSMMLGHTFGAFMMGPSPIVAIIVAPIAYFIAGFIGGVITGALYNLVAGWTGGIELTFEAPQP